MRVKIDLVGHSSLCRRVSSNVMASKWERDGPRPWKSKSNLGSIETSMAELTC